MSSLVQIDGRTQMSDELQELGLTHVTGLLWTQRSSIGRLRSGYIGKRITSPHYRGILKRWSADFGVTGIIAVTSTGEVWVYTAGSVPEEIGGFCMKNFESVSTSPAIRIRDLSPWHVKVRDDNPYCDFDGHYPAYSFAEKEEVVPQGFEDKVVGEY